MPTIKRLLITLAAIAFVVAAQPAFAQSKGPNGGMLVAKDGHETELVVSPTELTLYLIEKGKVQNTKGAVVRAVIQEGGKNITINMTVVDGKKLVAKLEAPLGKGAIVVVTGKDDHGHAVNARYVIE